MKKNMQGLTLIELMIVVAIIAILAAIALPAYQDYLIRSQVSEGLSLTSGAKSAVAESFANTGTMPTTNGEAGLEAAANINGKYVTQVAVGAGGAVTATFGNEANSQITGDTLILTPTPNAGSVEWDCSSTTIAAKHLPTACR